MTKERFQELANIELHNAWFVAHPYRVGTADEMRALAQDLRLIVMNVEALVAVYETENGE